MTSFAGSVPRASGAAFLQGFAPLVPASPSKSPLLSADKGSRGPAQGHAQWEVLSSPSCGTTAALLGSVFAACAVATRRAPRRAQHRTALAASGFRTKPASNTEQAGLLEAALLDLFEDGGEPSIFKVRDCLTRLARLTKTPNTLVAGHWIIYWASREGVVDRIFGTGQTLKDDWLQLQEFLLRITSKKEGRVIEAAEIIRRVGPFPNQSNSLKGSYGIMGTNGLKIVFDRIKTDEEKDVEVDGEKVSAKEIDVDVIYASKKVLAMQTTDEGGECDFFVLTPIESLEQERNRLVGGERRRFFFN